MRVGVVVERDVAGCFVQVDCGNVDVRDGHVGGQEGEERDVFVVFVVGLGVDYYAGEGGGGHGFSCVW